MLLSYGNNFVKALLHMFPEIGLDKTKFHFRLPSMIISFPICILINFHADKYWSNETNQREYFISFAKHKKFDPLVPDNWYPITSESLSQYKVHLFRAMMLVLIQPAGRGFYFIISRRKPHFSVDTFVPRDWIRPEEIFQHK